MLYGITGLMLDDPEGEGGALNCELLFQNKTGAPRGPLSPRYVI